MDAKEYLKRKIREYDSGIDISPGSPMGDLFINPLSIIFQDNLDFEDHLLNVLGLEEPEQLSESELDAIASNFLVSRVQGAKAAGYIKMYYSTPVSVTVPKGTTFQTADGASYLTDADYSITKELMTLNNADYPLYSTGNIAISAASEGEEYIAKANTITKLISTISPEPSSVRNPVAVTGGLEKETNTALKAKIIDSVNNQSIASPGGIKRVLQTTFPTITSLTIKGNGENEMTRDITYSGVDVGNYYTSDFDAKVSGLNVYPYNESIAYVGRFQDTDDTTDVALPEPTGFTYEQTNEMYKGLYKGDDPLYAELGTYNILEENFNETETATGYKTPWVASDSSTGKGLLAKAEEIKVDGQTIKLGVKEAEPDADNPSDTGAQVTIPEDTYRNLLNELQVIIDDAEIEAQDQEDITYQVG